MRIAVAGTPQVAIPSLEALLASTHEVVAAISRPDAPVGRSRRPVPSPLASAAHDHGLTVLTPDHPRDESFAARLLDLGVEAVAVVAYGALLPQSVLDLVPHGWINLHFSLLPRWRGAAPVQHAIWAGDTETGVTTFQIVRALDAGPVYRTVVVPLAGTETSGEVLDHLAVRGAHVLRDTLDDVAAGVVPHAQEEQSVTLAPKITVQDAHIDWHQPALAVSRQVRAVTPAPGAWNLLHDQRFKVLSVTTSHGEAPALPPGHLAATKRTLWCGTSDRPLALLRVQPFGRQPMNGADWARGAQLDDSAVLR